MHDKLFANYKALKRPELEKYAGEVGLDMNKFKADLDNHTYKKEIQADQRLARNLGARGTPAFFVNGWKLSGAKPFSAFKEKIDPEIKAAEALVAKGTPKTRVYAELTKNGLTKAPARKKPDRKARPQKDPKAVYKVPVDNTQVHSGPPDALVTIAEVTDFQ